MHPSSDPRLSSLHAHKRITACLDDTRQKSPCEVLLSLRALGIELRADEDGLRVRAKPGVIDAAARAALQARKAELLSFLRTDARYVGHDAASAVDAVRAPLAATQRSLWLLQRMQPQATMYNLPYAFEIAGSFEVAALGNALRALVQRHAALRMRILDEAGDVRMEVVAQVDFAVPVIDISQAPDTLTDRLERDARHSFDLARAPLFQARIYRVGAERHVLFFNVHHIACDGWSIELLLEELSELYAATALQRPPRLPALRTSYLRHAQQQAQREAGPWYERGLARAVQRLQGIEPLELPTDHPRPARFSHHGATLPFSLSPELSRDLEALARQLDSTPFTVLLATYKLLLWRYSGQTDIVVGSPVAGRDREEDEQVVGFYARTLVTRTDLRGAPTFRELVARVRTSCLRAFEDEHVPFDRIAEALGTADRSRTPVFQTLFSLQETRPRVDPRTGRAWRRKLVSHGGAKTDLTLLLEHDGTQFTGELEFCIDLFGSVTIERLLRNYETLLADVVENPDRSIARVNLVHRSELEALARINETGRPVPELGGFYELFRRHARRAPERTAIVDRDGAMSYGELDGSSDAWAARLASLGVARGARVGVALERGRRVLEINLGIMKAGAAYVPLDTSFPRDRLAFMARDAGLSCIVADRAAVEKLPREVCPVFVLEEHEQTAAPIDWTPPGNAPTDVAYIIYTSGSTGMPKGVEVMHGGVTNLLLSMEQVPGCTENDRVMAVSTFSFDMCIAELYLPLAVGACTIIAPRTCAADGELLSRFIDEYGATFVQATPTSFKLLVEAGLPRQEFKAVGGGEPFPGQLARELSPSCPEVWNGYGPTETTVYTTFYRIADPERPVRIGLPIANVKLYVLDPAQQIVPFGVVGELYIGGAGVSAGYRNRSDLTGARFLPDPFAETAGSKMYRTGDLVRMHADGLQYIGRTDNQVKLRGYRIELGEIETALANIEAIDRAVVLVRELGDNDKRLVAYLVPKRGHEISIQSVRERLGKQLPSYMVPRLLIVLDDLPLTPSGKIDRKHLPDPRTVECEADLTREPPDTATEAALLEVWQRVLGTRDVGVTDDFFSVGGHSLLAVQLVKEVNRSLHTRLSVALVFEAPTIRKQAARINRGEHGGGVSLVPLRAGGSKEPLFCICGINLYQGLAAELDADRPIYGLFLPIEGELFDDPRVELDAIDMARQYLDAIRSVQPHGPYFLAGVSFGGALAYEIARQLIRAGESIGTLALLDTILPSSLPHSRTRKLARHAVHWARHHLPLLARASATGDGQSSHDSERAALAAAIGGANCDDETTAQLLRRMELYQRALASYESSMGSYDGDVLLVRAKQQAQQLAGCAADYGWGRHVRGNVLIHDLPGDHLGLLRPPHVRYVAQLLAAALAGAAREANISARAS